MMERSTVRYQIKEVDLSVLIDYTRETIWVTIEQMSLLFSRSKQDILKYIDDIIDNNEICEATDVNYYWQTDVDDKADNIKYYNLNMVVLVGNKIDLITTRKFKEFIDKEIKHYKQNCKQYEIIKFIDDSSENGFELYVNVDPNEETVWLTLGEISKLFDRDRSVISKHIKNIYKNQELSEDITCAKNAHMGHNTNRKYESKIYNLDVILSVGYRVNSKRGSLFRKWANKILIEYLLKGYVINSEKILSAEENYKSLLKKVDKLSTYNTNIIGQINNIKTHQLNIAKRLTTVENKMNEYDLPVSKIIFQDEYYDAYSLIQSIFEKATEEIIIIDNYIDRTILDRLVLKKKNVRVIIHTNLDKSKLIQSDINSFNRQYGLLNIIDTKNIHDRYIIIDKSILYNVGGSIKDLGKKLTTLHLLDSGFIGYILNNI